MKKYKSIIIVSNKIDNNARIEVLNDIKNFINKNGELVNVEDLGEKKLAYIVRKHKSAYYYIIEFQIEKYLIGELEKIFRVKDEIIKYIIYQE